MCLPVAGVRTEEIDIRYCTSPIAFQDYYVRGGLRSRCVRQSGLGSRRPPHSQDSFDLTKRNNVLLLLLLKHRRSRKGPPVTNIAREDSVAASGPGWRARLVAGSSCAPTGGPLLVRHNRYDIPLQQGGSIALKPSPMEYVGEAFLSAGKSRRER